ncbi:MAG: hypothetical protein WED07_14115 [Candidatus Freyarchaeum deiterrae]
MVEKEKNTDYNCSRTSLVKKWKGKQFRLAHFLVAMLLVIGGLVVASYAYSQYSQSNVTTQLIGYNMLCQSGIQTQIKGMPSIPKIDEIVPVAQSGCVDKINTEQGTINVIGMNVPKLFPICVSNDTLASYWVAVKVYGGYVPCDGSICVIQGKEGKQGTIGIQWNEASQDVCCTSIWNATFYVSSSFCVDSNQYPAGACIPDHYQTIPGKDITLCWNTCWTGCHELNQHFGLIPVQNN